MSGSPYAETLSLYDLNQSQDLAESALLPHQTLGGFTNPSRGDIVKGLSICDAGDMDVNHVMMDNEPWQELIEDDKLSRDSEMSNCGNRNDEANRMLFLCDSAPSGDRCDKEKFMTNVDERMTHQYANVKLPDCLFSPRSWTQHSGCFDPTDDSTNNHNFIYEDVLTESHSHDDCLAFHGSEQHNLLLPSTNINGKYYNNCDVKRGNVRIIEGHDDLERAVTGQLIPLVPQSMSVDNTVQYFLPPNQFAYSTSAALYDSLDQGACGELLVDEQFFGQEEGEHCYADTHVCLRDDNGMCSQERLAVDDYIVEEPFDLMQDFNHECQRSEVVFQGDCEESTQVSSEHRKEGNVLVAAVDTRLLTECPMTSSPRQQMENHALTSLTTSSPCQQRENLALTSLTTEQPQQLRSCIYSCVNRNISNGDIASKLSNHYENFEMEQFVGQEGENILNERQFDTCTSKANGQRAGFSHGHATCVSNRMLKTIDCPGRQDHIDMGGIQPHSHHILASSSRANVQRPAVLGAALAAAGMAVGGNREGISSSAAGSINISTFQNPLNNQSISQLRVVSKPQVVAMTNRSTTSRICGVGKESSGVCAGQGKHIHQITCMQPAVFADTGRRMVPVDFRPNAAHGPHRHHHQQQQQKDLIQHVTPSAVPSSASSCTRDSETARLQHKKYILKQEQIRLHHQQQQLRKRHMYKCEESRMTSGPLNDGSHTSDRQGIMQLTENCFVHDTCNDENRRTYQQGDEWDVPHAQNGSISNKNRIGGKLVDKEISDAEKGQLCWATKEIPQLSKDVGTFDYHQHSDHSDLGGDPQVELSGLAVTGESSYFSGQILPCSLNVPFLPGMSAHNKVLCLSEQLEREVYRRKYCEQQVQQLNVKLLEVQQQLAVAVSTDHRKDNMIGQLNKQLVKMVNGWRRKEFEKDRVLQTAVEEKNRLENDLIEQRAAVDGLERDVGLKLGEQKCKQEQTSAMLEGMKEELAECRQKRVDAEQLLSVEKDTVAAVQHDLQCTKNSLDLAEKRAEKAQVLLRQEEINSQQSRKELMKKIDQVKDANLKVMQMEKVKLEEQTRRARDLEEKLYAMEVEIHRLDVDLDASIREKESLKVEIALLEDKFENTLSALKAEFKFAIDKQVSLAVEDESSHHQEEIDDMEKRHQSVMSIVEQQHFEELDRQVSAVKQDAAQCQELLRQDVNNMIIRLRNANEEILSLRQSKQKVESQRLEILSKLQFMMQSQWNEAVSLLVNTPHRKTLCTFSSSLDPSVGINANDISTGSVIGKPCLGGTTQMSSITTMPTVNDAMAVNTVSDFNLTTSSHSNQTLCQRSGMTELSGNTCSYALPLWTTLTCSDQPLFTFPLATQQVPNGCYPACSIQFSSSLDHHSSCHTTHPLTSVSPLLLETCACPTSTLHNAHDTVSAAGPIRSVHQHDAFGVDPVMPYPAFSTDDHRTVFCQPLQQQSWISADTACKWSDVSVSQSFMKTSCCLAGNVPAARHVNAHAGVSLVSGCERADEVAGSLIASDMGTLSSVRRLDELMTADPDSHADASTVPVLESKCFCSVDPGSMSPPVKQERLQCSDLNAVKEVEQSVLSHWQLNTSQAPDQHPLRRQRELQRYVKMLLEKPPQSVHQKLESTSPYNPDPDVMNISFSSIQLCDSDTSMISEMSSHLKHSSEELSVLKTKPTNCDANIHLQGNIAGNLHGSRSQNAISTDRQKQEKYADTHLSAGLLSGKHADVSTLLSRCYGNGLSIGVVDKGEHGGHNSDTDMAPSLDQATLTQLLSLMANPPPHHCCSEEGGGSVTHGSRCMQKPQQAHHAHRAAECRSSRRQSDAHHRQVCQNTNTASNTCMGHEQQGKATVPSVKLQPSYRKSKERICCQPITVSSTSTTRPIYRTSSKDTSRAWK